MKNKLKKNLEPGSQASFPGYQLLLSNTRLSPIRCKLGTRQVPALGGRAGRRAHRATPLVTRHSCPGSAERSPPLSPPTRRATLPPSFVSALSSTAFSLSDLRARNPTIRVFVVIFFGDLRSLTSRIFFFCDDFSHMQGSED
jgi:hypothetical protein